MIHNYQEPVLAWDESKQSQRFAFHVQSRRNHGKYRFFETEGIAALTTLVSRYKIELHPEFAAGTLEEKKEKLLAARPGLTLTWVPFV